MKFYIIKQFIRKTINLLFYKIKRIFKDINSILKFFLLCLIILAIIRGVANGYWFIERLFKS